MLFSEVNDHSHVKRGELPNSIIKARPKYRPILPVFLISGNALTFAIRSPLTMLHLFRFLLFCFLPALAYTQPWITIPVIVNSQSASFIFDTGSNLGYVLSKQGARKVNLPYRVPEQPINGEAILHPLPATSPTSFFSLGLTLTDARFPVIDLPIKPDTGIIGLMGWPVIQGNCIRIEIAKKRIQFGHVLTKAEKKWLKVRLLQSDIMAFEIVTQEKISERVIVDTGSWSGIALSPARWKEWRSQNPAAATTLIAYYTPASGYVIQEECWADSYELGPLRFFNVPVMPAPAGTAVDETFVGLGALRGFDLVIDGPNRLLHISKPLRRSVPYVYYNRIGAVFVPRDAGNSLGIYAVVAAGSPAHKSGLMTGDRLIAINDKEIDLRRGDAFTALTDFSAPAGTRYTFRISRGAETLTIKTVSQDILKESR